MHHPFRITVLTTAILATFVVHAREEETDPGAVVVTATRQPTRINEQLADVTVIEKETIEQAGATTLPELLSRQPGVQLVTNGGLGKESSIFIRGTNAGHTLLLVDGMPLGSATKATPSFTNLPLSQIERIEILRGPASSLYGSDAIGGVIQVFTKQGAGKLQPEIFVGAGSYGTFEAQAGVSGGTEQWSYSLRASKLETDGMNVAAGPVRFGSNYNPDSDPYQNTAWSGRLAFRPAAGHELGVTLLNTDSTNHYDGAKPPVDSYSNDTNRAWTAYSRNQLAQIWTSTLRYGESKDWSESFAPGRSLFATEQKQWTWQNDIKLPLGSLMLATEHLRQNVESTTNFKLKNRTVDSFIAGYNGNWENHSWQISQRYDDNSQFGGKTTGSLAYGYRLNTDWQARAAYGTAFKAPSFNQLYSPNTSFYTGNPDLNPEFAKNREVGLNWNHKHQRASITYFDNRIENLIINAAFPPPASKLKPKNINRARITGTSLSYGLTYGAWNADAGLDFMKPIDQSTGNRLPRRAAKIGKLSVSYAPGPWTLGAELNAVGDRFDTATQTKPLDQYEVVNLYGSYKLGQDWTLEGRVNNLFDKVYETAWSYAQPRANVFLGVRYAPK
ncbi:MAG: TonB-dependent receptor [Rugosibacter sp.]|nr:TonB-dependent receptor [Rugosibacter sp.]